MQHRRRKQLLAAAIAGGLALAACGSDDKAATTTTAAAPASSAATETTGATETTAGSETTEATDTTVGSDTTEVTDETTETTGGDTSTPAADGVNLADICPATVKIQTDWVPEAEHGFLYQMIGDDYTIDADNATVTGSLIDQDGKSTGVKVEVLSGGGATNFQTVTSILYQDDSILLGYVYTDEAIQNSDTFPTVAVESGFDKNPQMIMWDPATYPDVTDIAGLGAANVTVRYFGGAAYMDYFTSQGILSKDQVDGSYNGDPSLFVGDEGKAAQQGFGSAEPYLYENEIEGWKKPVKYQYINDVGWENYAESIATKPENITKYSDCLKALVPIIQHAAVDYLGSPDRANAIILAAVDSFGGNFGWTYSAGTAEYAVQTMKDDGLVANGPDDTMGKFDMDRVADLITKAIPVYTAQDTPPKSGLTPEDIVTNEFLDPSIGL